MYEKLRDAKYISVCDVRHGFWNAPVSECSKKYLGMSTPFGETFVWNVVPQGFINSSAHFQDFMERKLRKHGALYEPSILSDPDTEIHNSSSGFKNKKVSGKNTNSTSSFKEKTDSSSDKVGYVGYAACYQDDVILFSKTASEHKEHILKMIKI